MFEITDEMRDAAWEAIGSVAAEGRYEIDITELDDEPFLIVGSWEALSALNDAINQAVCPDAWAQWRPFYVERGGTGGPFSSLRVGQMRDGEERAPYLIPEDLLALEELAEVGFNDEYTLCAHCFGVIRTTPDCYGWTPDFWFDELGCEYLCGDCVRRDFAEDYIEDRTRLAKEGRAVGADLLLDPYGYGFEKVAAGLEHGMHPGQADDPRKILAWADEAGLEVVFTLRPGQFDVHFDVWMRGEDLDVDAVRMALFGYTEEPRYGDTLLAEFRQYPDPATLLQRSLKAASEAGESFVRHHGDGTYTAYDSPEELFADGL